MIPTIRQRRHLVKTCPDTNQAVLLDHRIWDTRYPFACTLYTREQNALMYKYRGAAGDAP